MARKQAKPQQNKRLCRHGKIIGTGELAKLLGITSRRVQQLVQNEGMPQLERGKFDDFAALAWMAGYLERKLQRQGDTLVAEQARLYRMRSLTKELEISIKKGALLPGEVVDNLLVTYGTALREGAIGITTQRYAHQLQGRNPAEIEEKFTSWILRVCSDAEKAANAVMNRYLGSLPGYSGPKFDPMAEIRHKSRTKRSPRP